MNLSKIYAVPGKSGLFYMVSHGKASGIVESLEDKKRFPVFTSDKISSLEEIAVYTEEEEVPLKKVMQNIFRKEEGKPCIDHKSETKALQAYFAEILPTYDRVRVYQSDIKKILYWYNLLIKNNLVDLEEDTDQTPADENA